PEPIPVQCRLCRQDSARGETSRHPGPAANQIRAGHQSQDRQDARPRSAGDPARPRRRGDRMRRREFITLLGGAAAWPLAARAQQPDRMRRIGVLMNFTADDPVSLGRVTAFVQGLQELGWTIGRNLQIEYRWGAGNVERYRTFAAELVALTPDILATAGAPAVEALQRATRTVPIVFTNVTDPVGGGLVASLARPGGNTTGFTISEYGLSGKWLELLKEIAPRVMRAAVLRDPVAVGIGQFAAIQAIAPSLQVELSPIDVRDAGEMERTVTAFAHQPNGGLIATASAFTAIHRKLIIG